MNAPAERGVQRRVGAFFLLTFAFAAPFWAWGALGGKIIPGLPVSGLMAFVPGFVALLLAGLNKAGAGALLGETFDLHRLQGKSAWIALNFALFPALLTCSYVLMRVTGEALPAPQFSVFAILAMFLGFLAAGFGEELGWFGFAFPRLEWRYGPTGAALIIGVIWTAWHIIPYVQTDRPFDWIAWHCVVTIATRVIAVWLFVKTGRSVFAAALFHAMCNVAYFSFPRGGSHYDPAYFAPIVVSLAVAIAMARKAWARGG